MGDENVAQTPSGGREGHVATVILNRPDVRNAFNEVMIDELTRAFAAPEESVRAVILTGSGHVFCAGADVNWMKRSAGYSEAENGRDAAAMAAMFRAIDECPCPVIGRINGPALGGGMGLIACCDVAVAVNTAQFGYSEARLGIIPAVISPFSLARIGAAAARRYFLTAERFDAAEAVRIGLVNESVDAATLDLRVDQIVQSILRNGPNAVRAAKALIRSVAAMNRDEANRHTVATIARLRTSAEGQEGLGAFLEKRDPDWL
ncbi:MAG: enoyl-CoA hydratase/isomerase family protein [candidate division Zixibacteria bacterium]|nr:enoyl-CoA hydratase/isomerase family protein [candidate division Zixibacteria bacterium]